MEKAPDAKLVSTWEMLYKDAEGEGHIETLHKYEYDQEVDESRFLSQAAPTKITPSRARSKKRESLLLADIPDIHYGFRRLPDGTLLPTHRPEVMDVTSQIIRDAKPDTIILGGDILDAPQVGRYEMDSNHFVDTLQLSLDGLHRYLAQLRADNPNARIINTKGNHDERFEKFLLKNAKPLFGIKPANMPSSWATNSIPFLLRFDELGIEQETGPVQITDKLITMHGEFAGDAVKKYLGRYACSVMFHHDHRRGYGRRVFPNGQAIEAFSFGCEADVTGSVPSYHNKVNDRGLVVERYEDWSNGMGFLDYSEKTGSFKPLSVPIEHQDGYEAVFNDRVYQARLEVAKALETI